MFDESPKSLLDKVEQVVRLVRSKGVGVYFISQNPIDIPESIAGQLGNRVQHALRAFTPRDQRAIKAAAETFRANPGVDVGTAITQLRVGEALVSVLMADGAPTPVERTLIAPPRSRVGPVTPAERSDIVNASPLTGKYDDKIDRESAWEMLNRRAAETATRTEAEKRAALQAKLDASAAATADKEAAAAAKAMDRERVAAARTAARPQPKSFAEKMIESTARSAATSVGRQLAGSFGSKLLRGLLGGLLN